MPSNKKGKHPTDCLPVCRKLTLFVIIISHYVSAFMFSNEFSMIAHELLLSNNLQYLHVNPCVFSYDFEVTTDKEETVM